MTRRLVVLPAALVSGRYTHPGAVNVPARAQDFTWSLKDGSHAASISLFSKFHALRLRFPCLFSLLPLVYSHVPRGRKNRDILSLFSVLEDLRDKKTWCE